MTAPAQPEAPTASSVRHSGTPLSILEDTPENQGKVTWPLPCEGLEAQVVSSTKDDENVYLQS